MDEIAYFDAASGVYRFIDALDGDDSGVEDLPFTSYFDLDNAVNHIHVQTSCGRNQKREKTIDFDEDEYAYEDDERDEDYKPNKSAWSVKKV